MERDRANGEGGGGQQGCCPVKGTVWRLRSLSELVAGAITVYQGPVSVDKHCPNQELVPQGIRYRGFCLSYSNRSSCFLEQPRKPSPLRLLLQQSPGNRSEYQSPGIQKKKIFLNTGILVNASSFPKNACSTTTRVHSPHTSSSINHKTHLFTTVSGTWKYCLGEVPISWPIVSRQF